MARDVGVPGATRSVDEFEAAGPVEGYLVTCSTGTVAVKALDLAVYELTTLDTATDELIALETAVDELIISPSAC